MSNLKSTAALTAGSDSTIISGIAQGRYIRRAGTGKRRHAAWMITAPITVTNGESSSKNRPSYENSAHHTTKNGTVKIARKAGHGSALRDFHTRHRGKPNRAVH